jgi:uncharacterized protein with HEPN domain
MWRDEGFLLDMLLAAQDARRFVNDMNWEAFAASDLHQSAVIRQLEILGEAANQVSNAFQTQLPEIPWPGIIGMRHRLIHGYRAVRVDKVWDVVQRELPPLIETLTPLLPPEQEAPPKLP